MITPCFIANWKMHKTVQEALAYLDVFEAALVGLAPDEVKIILAPPCTALSSVSERLKRFSFPVGLAAQHIYYEEQGAYTGEISPRMVQEFCQYAIIGHSERRTLFGETGEQIHKKVAAALKSGLTPILCIGETQQQRNAEKTLSTLESQLTEALQGPSEDLSSIEPLLIAYEPVWAIGSGTTPDPCDIEKTHLHIFNYSKALCPKRPVPPILYGGSVNEKNIDTLMRQGHVDGVLVGGTSLSPDSFAKIIALGIKTKKEKPCTYSSPLSMSSSASY